jgi:hypothetical protein
VITAGVDFATEAANTALATIEWLPRSAVVRGVTVGVDDDAIVDAARPGVCLGIDCPFGWPDDFVAFVHEHHTGTGVAPKDVAGRQWRRLLANRATDLAVRRATDLTPLSVSTDRIGLTAIRLSGVFARLAAAGYPVDRAGEGDVVEVYPAASLKCWGLPYRGYKGVVGRPTRELLIAALCTEAPWLDLGPNAELCALSDHALDAVIAALTSRAKALSLTTEPSDDVLRDRARREGWIAFPVAALDSLLPA